ncbi:MAG: [FeFe] hydrogenase H-cluster radical SAM maturase HydE [Eubacteriales bacterium]|nr:[FeFe] hydrogenase H-cluster radical SAM maturase HydE [Eubacteriales bacterium]
MSELTERLQRTQNLSDEELMLLIEGGDDQEDLRRRADAVRREHYGTDVYTRGLIEFTNYCRNDCYYCGIRRSNTAAKRYRLSEEEILACCAQGYELDFRTFVLQGGEDGYFTDDRICSIVTKIRERYPDCAITLSLGEKERESLRRFRDAGANRYLLRHETADDEHYKKLHPAQLSLAHRKECLWNLKELGYQVGSGFMVGSPYQTTQNLVSDLRFLQELQPDMIGIGPYLTHKETPFREFPNGSMEQTLHMISILRLMFPYALLPATTALGTIHPRGREMGLQAGANVVMPNLSPTGVRKLYQLYENKICTGDEAAECRSCLSRRVASVGYQIVTDVGDVKRS